MEAQAGTGAGGILTRVKQETPPTGAFTPMLAKLTADLGLVCILVNGVDRMERNFDLLRIELRRGPARESFTSAGARRLTRMYAKSKLQA